MKEQKEKGVTCTTCRSVLHPIEFSSISEKKGLKRGVCLDCKIEQKQKAARLKQELENGGELVKKRVYKNNKPDSVINNTQTSRTPINKETRVEHLIYAYQSVVDILNGLSLNLKKGTLKTFSDQQLQSAKNNIVFLKTQI